MEVLLLHSLGWAARTSWETEIIPWCWKVLNAASKHGFDLGQP